MAKFNCVVFLGVVAAAIGMVLAITDEEKAAVRANVLPLLAECGKEFKISQEDLLAAKEAHDLDAINPCFYACFFKKAGIMNDQGLYDTVAAKAGHKTYIHGQDDLAKLDAITDTCAAVNEETVSDGANGCDRAKLLARCVIENKGSFNPLSE